MMKKIYLPCYFIAAALCVIFSNAFAGELLIEPQISLKETYNDNILFENNDTSYDFISTITPAISIDYASDDSTVDTNYATNLIYYADNSNLDKNTHHFNLNAEKKFLQRWKARGYLSAVKDTTLDLDEETGRIEGADISDRYRYKARAGAAYQVTQLSYLVTDYTYEKTEYDEDDRTDYDVNTISLSFRKQLKNQIDIISLVPGFSRNDSDISRADTTRLSVKWERLLNPAYSLSASVGGRYTDTDYKKSGRNESSNGVVVDVTIHKKSANSSSEFKYKRDITNADNGDLIEVDRFICEYTHRITRRFGAELEGRVYLTRSDEKDNEDDDRRYFEITPALSYLITRNQTLKLEYSYSQEYDKNQPDDKYTRRNSVWLLYRIGFPFTM